MTFNKLGKGHSFTISAESGYLTRISHVCWRSNDRLLLSSEAESSLIRPVCVEEAAVTAAEVSVCLFVLDDSCRVNY